MCVCVCVCVVWCICIHNCLASCCAPIRGSIPPGLEGGEVFCYADTIDGNCRPAKNLKMWLPVCVRTSSHPVQWPRVQKSPTRPLCRDSHWKRSLAWTAIQKTTSFGSPLYFWQTPELCAQSLCCVLRSPFRRASHSKTVDRHHFPCYCIRQQPNV